MSPAVLPALLSALGAGPASAGEVSAGPSPAGEGDPVPASAGGEGAGPAAAGPPPRGPLRELDLGLSSEALGTLHLGVGLAPSPRPAFGVGLDLPVTLWAVSGVPDTARASGRAAVRRDGARVGLDLGLELRLGVQVDTLGVRVGLDTILRGGPALVLGRPGAPFRARLPLRLAVEQPLATLVTFSEYAREAFVDSGTGAPRAGVVPFGRGRVVVGAGFALPVAEGWELHGAFDLAWAPGPLGLDAWQQLTVGQVPLRAEVGVLRRW